MAWVRGGWGVAWVCVSLFFSHTHHINQLNQNPGRERHANHRDDMDGVGSFNNPSRTLYVGGILVRMGFWEEEGQSIDGVHVFFFFFSCFLLARIECMSSSFSCFLNARTHPSKLPPKTTTRAQKSTYRNQEEVEAALWKHFGEWGEVEHINFVPRCVACVLACRRLLA